MSFFHYDGADVFIIWGLPCNDFVSVRDQLWVLNMTSYWPYAVRSWNVCAKKYVRMPWGTVPETDSFRKMGMKWFLP